MSSESVKNNIRYIDASGNQKSKSDIKSGSKMAEALQAINKSMRQISLASKKSNQLFISELLYFGKAKVM